MTTKKNPKTGTDGSVYVLKITLLDINPRIWRKIQLSANFNLGFLHAVIQIVMGWTNSHLHHFQVGKKFFIDPLLQADDGMEPEYNDSFRTSLSEIASHEGSRFLYEYDFGDCWSHEVVVEKILSSGGSPTGAVCLDGANACPPEDCGGTGGYEDLLKVIKNPDDPEYENTQVWLGGDFDPAEFDLNKANKYLAMLKNKSPSQEYLSNILIKRDGVHEDVKDWN